MPTYDTLARDIGPYAAVLLIFALQRLWPKIEQHLPNILRQRARARQAVLQQEASERQALAQREAAERQAALELQRQTVDALVQSARAITSLEAHMSATFTHVISEISTIVNGVRELAGDVAEMHGKLGLARTSRQRREAAGDGR